MFFKNDGGLDFEERIWTVSGKHQDRYTERKRKREGDKEKEREEGS